jgi:hypothetical protein
MLDKILEEIGILEPGVVKASERPAPNLRPPPRPANIQHATPNIRLGIFEPGVVKAGEGRPPSLRVPPKPPNIQHPTSNIRFL